MEHIPSGNLDPGIEIPVIGVLEYDGGESTTYPARHGWDEEMIFTQRDFGDKSPVAVETFFQTWLYFGLLICTFRTVGISVDTADFIRTCSKGNKIITTQQLPQYLQRWRDRYRLTKAGEDRDTKNEHWPVILKMLRKAHDYVDRYCNDYSQRFVQLASVINPRSRPISPQVSLSIIALGQAITSAATNIYSIPESSLQIPWGTSSLLRQRLHDLGWCTKDISSLCDPRETPIEVQYYVSTVPYSRASIDHVRCNKSVCSGERVDTENYVTQHVDRSCQCMSLEIDQSSLGILRRGGIPLITFRTHDLQEAPAIEVTEYNPQSSVSDRYVAISHVWADGLGNRHVNGLPICQLSRLQNLVNDLYASHPDVPLQSNTELGGPTRFWIDTLCVPLHDTECRKLAVRRMTDTYALADRVLVLDSWILRGSSNDPILERSIRLMMSNWQRRLWTLSEAVLSKNLYIQFGDNSLHTASLLIECKNHYAHSVEFYDNITAFALAKSMPVLWFGPNVPMWRRFDALMFHIGKRATSWPSDETVCFSSLLALSPQPLEDIPRNDLEARMTKFLTMVGTFRQQIIFNQGPRCQAEGFGWAPASFLNRVGASVVTDRGEGDVRVGNLDPCGGLLISYSGIRLGSVAALLRDRCVVTMKSQTDLGLLCSFRTDEPGEKIAPWDTSSEYFIISYVPMNALLGSGPSQSVALIGSLKDVSISGRLKIKFLYRAVLLRLSKLQIQEFESFWSQQGNSSQESSEARLVEGILLDVDQDWCVV